MTATNRPTLAELEHATEFLPRHLGPDAADEARMLPVIGASSRAALIEAVVPASIARPTPMDLPAPVTERAALAELAEIAGRNRVLRSFIGQGYHGTVTPGVILRNVLENPAWYTAYTPYQAEISQGRLEALLNFQTLITDLTGMAIANASMLDEATAAAEAMTLAKRSVKSRSNVLVVSGDTHPQILEVLRTRARPLGLQVLVADSADAWEGALDGELFAAFVQYPASSGWLNDWSADAARVRAKGAAFIVAADPLALTLLKPPGEWGADIVVGSTQRFGMPMGAGGPHAAYLACRDEFKRSMPGRLVGVSVDAAGRTAYRLALQTREQHIRREKATSNICTAQVLPAVVASLYAVWHGPDGLKRIATRVATYADILVRGLAQLGWPVERTHHAERGFFDTIGLRSGADTARLMARAVELGANLRCGWGEYLMISLDETTTRDDLTLLWRVFAAEGQALPDVETLAADAAPRIPAALQRTSAFLTHPVFNTHHSETEMLRYLRRLADKDLALDRSMIPLGSCTMKLNATSEMIPITWPAFAHVHPYAPRDQLAGYEALSQQLCAWLAQATGYAGISLQPNAGSQGEYAGLLAIQAWHASRGEAHRTVCLIPESAHGTNPASAQMVGLRVVVVKCDANGSVDLDDLRAKCEQHAAELACIMITYPSTYGVFEPRVRELCQLVHDFGGRVYVDGANMNALVGLAAPGEFGGDVSHLNLHKTFCIPHGGGGPGVGPVCVVEDLVPFLPAEPGGDGTAAVGAVSAAPWGNAAVLPISWMYIRMMGAAGLQAATETAILNANYIAARLAPHYDIHFSGGNDGIAGGGVAHECILDLRPLKETSGVTAEDVAKRLIDYGFHAPTLSFPVAGTLMVEPTESEPLVELDRFCDAMIAIREEIRRVEQGHWPRDDHPLKNAPHTAEDLLHADWGHPYSREEAAYPVGALRRDKYWSPVSRIDNVHGDRNLFCSCVPMSELAD